MLSQVNGYLQFHRAVHGYRMLRLTIFIVIAVPAWRDRGDPLFYDGGVLARRSDSFLRVHEWSASCA